MNTKTLEKLHTEYGGSQGKLYKTQSEQLENHLYEHTYLYVIEGVHPTHNVQPAYGWIKRGMRKEIPANTGRSRINLSGSINVVTHDIVIQEDRRRSDVKFRFNNLLFPENGEGLPG